MNALVIFGAVLAAAAAVNGQGCGGCGAPTIINIGNSGGSCGQPMPPPPPPPPPSPVGGDPYAGMTNLCDLDANGYPTVTPPGGWPADYHYTEKCDQATGVCLPDPVWNDPSVLRIPDNWDGNMQSLPFPLIPGTAQYNVFACWIIPVPTGR